MGGVESAENLKNNFIYIILGVRWVGGMPGADRLNAVPDLLQEPVWLLAPVRVPIHNTQPINQREERPERQRGAAPADDN
jgi:hypothetical protein